jgi:Caspase domain
MFAILVGIDKYLHYIHLTGAVYDASCMRDFLSSKLSVPQDRIRTLLDDEATKVRIIEEIQALKTNPDIQCGDPILVYFAGHGARSPVPVGHNSYANEGWFESLCPVDISPPNASSPVTAIPDVVLGFLISELAEKKGDNIVCSLQRDLRI